MSKLPDFTKLALNMSAEAGFEAWETAARDAQQTGEAIGLRQTPENIDVKALFTAKDRDGLPFLDNYPGLAPFIRGPYATCMSTSRGQCANMPVFPRRKNPTLFTGAT